MPVLESDKHTEELATLLRTYMRYRDWMNFAAGVVSGTVITYYLTKGK
jgi:hypothetical protein